jgi:hypothetical protein
MKEFVAFLYYPDSIQTCDFFVFTSYATINNVYFNLLGCAKQRYKDDDIKINVYTDVAKMNRIVPDAATDTLLSVAFSNFYFECVKGIILFSPQYCGYVDGCKYDLFHLFLLVWFHISHIMVIFLFLLFPVLVDNLTCLLLPFA